MFLLSVADFALSRLLRLGFRAALRIFRCVGFRVVWFRVESCRLVTQTPGRI